MAELLLRTLGGTEARIILVGAHHGSEQQRQLGMVAPQYREVVIAPAVFRSNRQPQRSSAIEVLLPAGPVLKRAELEGELNGAAWLRRACGVEYDGVTLRITDVKTEKFAGQAYLYRVVAEE